MEMEFEKKLAELEKIVKALESDSGLDKALELFGKGIELSRECLSELNAKKGKLLELTDELNNITTEFKIG